MRPVASRPSATPAHRNVSPVRGGRGLRPAAARGCSCTGARGELLQCCLWTSSHTTRPESRVPQALEDPALQLAVELRARAPERLGVLRPEHEDRLRPAGQDAGGRAPNQQPGPEAHDGSRDGVHARAHGEADARADRAADDAAQEGAEADHGVDQQRLHDVEQVRARHHAVRDPRRLEEGHAPHGALHVRPLAEELQDVADARHDALQGQERDAREGVPLLLGIGSRLAHRRLECPDGGDQEGAQADAAE
mmetsp:Transcript_111479/g.348679  ORF Transcript_111479/g.348679 Transcript_111479/m.348679 type:complete len:251 (-) Transcript_111479:540-1292(-)